MGLVGNGLVGNDIGFGNYCGGVGGGLSCFLGGFGGSPILAFLQFVVKTLAVIFLLSLIRALTSRIRVDQVVSFAWKTLAPLVVLQLLIVILIKGLLQ